MHHNLLIFFIFLLNNNVYSQKFEKIEFKHSNAIIIGKSVNITLEPLKNNKSGKVKVIVKKDKENEHVLKISEEKYREIYNSIQKIKYDTVAVKDNLLDPSSTDILMYDNLGKRKSYAATGLNKKSQTDINQKDFWIVTRLIIKAAKLKMADLIGYR